jgi:hypothetical protein
VPPDALANAATSLAISNRAVAGRTLKSSVRSSCRAKGPGEGKSDGRVISENGIGVCSA